MRTEEARRSVNDLIDNATAVRGERFAMILRVAVNLQTFHGMSTAYGAPEHMAELLHSSTVAMLLTLLEVSDEESKEIDNLVGTVLSSVQGIMGKGE